MILPLCEPPGLKVKPPCFGYNIKVVLGGLFFFFFDGKAGVLLKETKVYITLVTTPGVHSLVSPKAARSLIYDISTKVV